MAPDGPARLTFVAGLRDRTARGEMADWRLEAADDLDPDLLCHLIPPSGPCTPAVRARWHEVHRFGLLYYRRGPGFVVVYDGRPIRVADEILLGEPAEVRLFERLLEPGPLDRGDPAARRLRAAKLLLEADGLAVTLPYREGRIALPLDIMSMPSNVPARVIAPSPLLPAAPH